MSTQEIINLVLLLSPIFLIQLALVIYALVDLVRKSQTRGPRWAWALALVLTCLAMPTGIIVAGVYLAWGRHPEAENDPDSGVDIGNLCHVQGRQHHDWNPEGVLEQQ